MGKVFCIGLGRTGTKSLARALKQLGYHIEHYPSDAITAAEIVSGRPLSILDRCDGLADLHAAVRFRELDAAYPESKFILTVRELQSWLDSMSRHFCYYVENPDIPPVSSMSRTLHLQAYGMDSFDPQRFTEAYARHVSAIREHFRGRYDQLLTLDIVGGDGWDRLCPFLGVPVPDRPFPRTR